MTPTEVDDRWNGTTERREATPSVIFAAIGLFITISSLLFSAGYNWRRITEVDEKHESFAKTVVNEYQRKDVQQEQNITMTSQLNAIREQIATLQRAAERRTRE